ncbi:MAG TPA: AraC family transcriptional regulator [Edaphobacter sp.]|nr:AraC family transcriptional regulator [Edaphobacter sp.]
MKTNSSLNLEAKTKGLPQVLAYGRTSDGLALQLRSDPAGVLEVPELQQVLVSIHVGQAAKISCRRGGQSHSGSAVHGDIDIVPAFTAARWEMHDPHDTALILSLPSSLMKTVAEENGFDSRRVEIRNRFQIRDTQLENICWALKTEMESNYPSGRLYVDSLVVSVASRLVSFHSSIEQSRPAKLGGLGGHSLKQTLAYIEDHLSEDVSLSQLASLAGISASHFKTLFRQSTGVPLHQYVIQRRLDRAKDLLMVGELSIAEIALASGFSHQSHLARHLRRALGLSPRVMKRLFADMLSIESK